MEKIRDDIHTNRGTGRKLFIAKMFYLIIALRL